jgi:acetyl-CoA C-acetyltransferase
MSPDPNGPVYLVAAARTPIGKFGGALSTLPATTLGAAAVAGVMEQAGVPGDAVDEVYMGQVLQGGAGMAPARQAALAGGLPEGVPATTVNRVCGSGLKAIMLAAAAIRAGDAEVLVAGGMESMSQGPYLLPRARFGYRLGHGQLVDSTLQDGLWCSIEDCHMGTHAERVAIAEQVSREDQDAWALRSHERALAAVDAGRFDDELVPLTVPGRRRGQKTVVDADEGPRRDTSAEALAGLRPVFDLPDDAADDVAASVTAGNAPGLSDGAAATIVASERAVQRLGLTPLARIVGYAQADLAPRWLFLAPIKGVQALAERTGIDPTGYDLVEINEAFAAQTVADLRGLDLDPDRVNVNGGAVALGHPLGASGARVVTTLLHELRRREGRYGLATLCLGGGGSVAMAFERVP